MLYKNYVASNWEKLNKQNLHVLYLIIIISLIFNFNKVANLHSLIKILDHLR